MLRHVATALACAFFCVITGVSNQTSQPPLRATATTAKVPTVGRVSALPRIGLDPFGSTNPRPNLIAASLHGSSERLDPFVPSGIGTATDAIIDPDTRQITTRALSPEEICQIVEEVAAENELPVPLFTRLIWQESRFNPGVISRAGARGIAQFMPGTAEERGLENPFDPVQALPASASFMRELVGRFGNFGLAAAAYNGGPRRVSEWLAGKGRLPKETREYVVHVTGRPAEHWAEAAQNAQPHPEAIKVEDCKVQPIRAALFALATNSTRDPSWGVQLAGSWSKKTAVAAYTRLKKKYPKLLGDRKPVYVAAKSGGKSAKKTLVRIAAQSRSEAEELCKRLKDAGGSCVVLKDPV